MRAKTKPLSSFEELARRSRLGLPSGAIVSGAVEELLRLKPVLRG